jgi:hypothetical protein
VYNQIFFTNVLRLLGERGMTKDRLADLAGMSVSFLSDLTNGAYSGERDRSFRSIVTAAHEVVLRG